MYPISRIGNYFFDYLNRYIIVDCSI